MQATWPATTAQLVGPSSLNLLTGPAHERVKRQLTAAVNPTTLSYVPLLQSMIAAAADRWVTTCSSGAGNSWSGSGGAGSNTDSSSGNVNNSDPGRGMVEVLQECKVLAFATMSACFLGFDTQQETVQRNVQAMVRLGWCDLLLVMGGACVGVVCACVACC